MQWGGSVADRTPARWARTNGVSLLGLVVVGLVSWGCASPGSPTTFRFPTMLEPTAAEACAIRLLRLAGFERSDSTGDTTAVVLLRRPPPSIGASEWWRVELSVVSDGDGGRVVQSIAGAARTAEGPWGRPPDDLQQVVGTLAGRCTW